MITIPLDICISSLIGASTFFFLTDVFQMRNDIARLPLVGGRSLISDELCEDFVNEYQSLPRDFWIGDLAPSEYDENLATLRDFIWNCKRRKIAEKSIINKLNDAQLVNHSEGTEISKSHVSIPDPGVSDDLEIEV
eukprot:CAMPEP_0184865848 /NCGR_PEP_ID=MMETSP0580-20130426/19419_1 /TAXON_ID=1118495 /ORGANISM="Dactyliosolen fragilissimus" /LENGTH=135 /DNA_ID=CAMNT_0027365219 /DNA_START=312 /DNA_END=719 /DNA_ORIENTATION=-